MSGCAHAAGKSGIPEGDERIPAAAISENEAVSASAQLCTYLDRINDRALLDSPYFGRAEKLIASVRQAGVWDANIKVYAASTLQLAALPPSCVRVWGGLFELFDDEELRFIVGQQIAHLKLGHGVRRAAQACSTLKRSDSMQQMPLADEQLHAAAAVLQRTGYSVDEELAADREIKSLFGPKWLDAAAALRALRKLSALRTGHESIFSAEGLARRIEQAGTEVRETKAASIEETLTKEMTPVDSAAFDWAEDHAPAEHSAAASPFRQADGAGGEPVEPQIGEVKTAVLTRPAALQRNQGTPAQEQREKTAGWFVQAAADASLEDALSRADSLRAHSFSARVQKTSAGGREYFRVLVGPYQSRTIAEQDIERIKNLGLAHGVPFLRRN